MMRKERLEKLSRVLAEEARKAGLSSANFDEVVHEQKSSEAADINNRGLRAQLTYLLCRYDCLDAGVKHLRNRIKNCN